MDRWSLYSNMSFRHHWCPQSSGENAENTEINSSVKCLPMIQWGDVGNREIQILFFREDIFVGMFMSVQILETLNNGFF